MKLTRANSFKYGPYFQAMIVAINPNNISPNGFYECVVTTESYDSPEFLDFIP